MKTLKIEGYKETAIKLFRSTDKVAIFSAHTTKGNGKKAYHVTVQVWATGKINVFSIESGRNVEHSFFTIN